MIKYDAGWGWSAPLHFADTTKDWQCTYIPSEHPDGICVVGAIANYTKRLLASDEQADENIALKFLIHFVGDIHQPLHVGFASNLGGNTLIGDFFSYKDNLHAIWDTFIIDHIVETAFSRSQDDFKSYLSKLLTTKYAKEMKIWMSEGMGEEASWASETASNACKFAYVNSTGSHISDHFSLSLPYFLFTRDIVELQLVKASARLAGLLNAIFDHKTAMR